MKNIKEEVMAIAKEAISANNPHKAVKETLKQIPLDSYHGKVYLLSIGKAAWTMAHSALESLKHPIYKGMVITKYGHLEGPLENLECMEAGHPIPDEASIHAASSALEMIKEMKAEDTLLILLSGGASALFEKPISGIRLEDIRWVNEQLLRSGADIRQINIVRKHLSAVKGGRLVENFKGHMKMIVLSDVMGDSLDIIGSGLAYADMSTSQEAFWVLSKYNIDVPKRIKEAMTLETPKEPQKIESWIAGNVDSLCLSAYESAKSRGYRTWIVSNRLEGEAKDIGREIAKLALTKGKSESVFYREEFRRPCVLIFGGETVVHVKGNGKGGRNQELALSAALTLENATNTVLLSIGSDGSDGPTDAAGGIVDGSTIRKIQGKGLDPQNLLKNNDAYRGLDAAGDLIRSGPTGTNVNDLIILMLL